MKKSVIEELEKRERSFDEDNLNKGSFMTVNKLEEAYPKLARVIMRNKLEVSSFKHMFIDDGNCVDAERLKEYFKQYGIQNIGLFLQTKNGKVSRGELESLLEETKLSEVIDRMQRRKRKYISDSMEMKKSSENLLGNEEEEGELSSDEKEAAVDKFRVIADAHTKNNFSLFKTYDRDGDGYISRSDFAQAMGMSNRLTAKETSTLFNEMDDGKKGYITFGNFAKVRSVTEDHNPSSVPCKEYHEKVKMMVSATEEKCRQSKFEKTKIKFDVGVVKLPPTRTSANPDYLLKNTFETVMAGRRPFGQSISEERQAGEYSLNQKLSYQVEDKLRKAQRLRAIGEQIRKNQERIEEAAKKNNSSNFYSEERIDHLSKMKDRSRTSYEMRVKLREQV